MSQSASSSPAPTPAAPPKKRCLVKATLNYYQQFDADYSRDVPGEGYTGWQKAQFDIDLCNTAFVVMHAWDTGSYEQYPGWHKAVEYIPRAQQICRDIFPPLLTAVRNSPMPLFHVVGGGNYYQKYSGHQRALKLAIEPPARRFITWEDETIPALHNFKKDHVHVGPKNRADVERGFANVNFDPHAMPQGDEGIAENAQQLFGLCHEAGVKHIIYIGFAINWCLLMSPGGMMDMSKYGFLCSAIRQATTAVENKESARQEQHKEEALWRVALSFGYVLDLPDFYAALAQAPAQLAAKA